MSIPGSDLARVLLESASVAIYHTDERGQITYANPEYRRIFNLAADETLGNLNWSLRVHIEDRERMQAEWADFCKSPRPAVFEYRTESEGKVRYQREELVAVRLGGGFVGTISDFSDFVTARRQLSEAESLFRHTIDQAPVGIAYANQAGIFQQCNLAFCEMLGFKAEALLGLSNADVTHPDDRATLILELDRLWIGAIAFIDREKRYIRKDGSTLWARVTIALVRDAAGRAQCSVGFLRDISQRRELSAQLKQQRLQLEAMVSELKANGDKYRSLIENTSAIPWELNRSTGASIYVAPQATKLFALKASSNLEIIELLHQEDMAAFLSFIKQSSDAGEAERRLDSRIIAGDGTLRHIRSYIADSANQPNTASICGISIDVTQQKQLEADLAQAQKLESIGQLAAGIAHEINTPTQFIGNNVGFLKDGINEILALIGQIEILVERNSCGQIASSELSGLLTSVDLKYLNAEMPRAVEQSLEGIGRIETIVGAMKQFSHPAVERTMLDINRAIESTIIVASNEWKYVAELESRLDPELPQIPVMPGMFNQVILNMIVNAAHALQSAKLSDSGTKGKITITTRRVGEWAEILIEDNGCGIAPHIRERIFDPFFTTKPVGKGTGQGLAIAHDVIVAKHGGSIAVTSEPNVGTTFLIRLPTGLRSSVATLDG